MNHAIAFNPLQFANRLKEAGVSEKHAEAEAEALREAFVEQGQAVSALEEQVKTLAAETRRDASGMATKGDIRDVKGDIKEVKGDLAGVKKDITQVKEELADVRSDIRLLKWMMGFVLAGIASLVAKSFF